MIKRIAQKTINNAIMPGRFIKRTIIISSICSILIGILGLAGYIPGLRFLGNIRSDYIPMAPSTAISFLILSIILIMHTLGFWPKRVRFFTAIILAAVSIFGFLKWIEYYVRPEGSFEESFMRLSDKIGEIPIGIMSPSTGALFFISAFIMIFLIFQVNGKKYTYFIGHLIGILGSLVIVSALIFVMSYLYGQPLLYNLGKTVPMAATTAFAFIFLGIALISAVGIDYTPLLFFTGPSVRSRLLRIFVPLIILIVFIQDISTKLIQNVFEINNALMMGLWIICFAALAGFIIFRSGHNIGSSLDKAHKEITSLSKFPSENPNPVIRIDKEGMVIYSNDAGKIQLKKLESKVGSKAPKIFYSLTDKLLKGKDKKPGLLDVQLGDKTYEFIISYIEDTDYANLYGRDVTDRIKAEDTLKKYSKNLEKMVEVRTKELKDAQKELIRKEKLAVLGQLAGGVAHELRNPLGAIKNGIYFLNIAIEKPQPKVKKTLEILDKAMVGSENIISSILNFSSSRTSIKKKVEIRNILQNIISRITIPDNIKVISKLDKSMPVVSADPGQITQVFSNIILNAIQSMPKGGKITVRSDITDNKWLGISVSDTGVGIPAENIDMIFEPLFTTKAKGIGLGLAVIKILVDAHEGRIKVKSKVGEGTTFTVVLPLKTKR